MKFMKKLQKLLSFLFVGVGLFALTGCESASRDAYVNLSESQVTVYEDTATSKRYASATIGIVNNTIYNVYGIDLTYSAFDKAGNPIANPETGTNEYKTTGSCYVMHGRTGYLTYLTEVSDVNVNSIKITSATPSKYSDLWTTYMFSFIIAFCIIGFSALFFGIEIFGRGLTREEVKEHLKAQASSVIVTVALLAIICIIPLIFSNWVTTVILFCGFGASLVVDVILTLIRMAFAPKE